MQKELDKSFLLKKGEKKGKERTSALHVDEYMPISGRLREEVS